MIKTAANWKSCWDSLFIYFFMARMNFQSQPRSGTLCEPCTRQTCKLGFLSQHHRWLVCSGGGVSHFSLVFLLNWNWKDRKQWMKQCVQKRLLVCSCLIVGVVLKCFLSENCQRKVIFQTWSPINYPSTILVHAFIFIWLWIMLIILVWKSILHKI